MVDTLLFLTALIGMLCMGSAVAGPRRHHRRHRRRMVRFARH